MDTHMKSGLIAAIIILTSTAVSMIFISSYVSFHEKDTLVAKYSISAWDAFSFSGIIITILAFVSAFFLLFMAIDAFSVSKAIDINSDTIKMNETRLNEQSNNIRNLEKLSENIDKKALLFEIIVTELSDASEIEQSTFNQIDYLAKKIGFEKEIVNLRVSASSSTIRIARIGALKFLTTDNPSSEMIREARTDALTLLESARQDSEIDKLLLLMMKNTIDNIIDLDCYELFIKSIREDLLLRAKLK